MNSRILELVEKSYIYDRQNDSSFFNKELFAQLIVRECAGVGYDASYYECALNVSNKIKQHFGVEE